MISNYKCQDTGSTTERTWSVACIQPLEEPIITFKWKSPPGESGTKEQETVLQVEREVVVRDKVCTVEGAKAAEVFEHMMVKRMSTFNRHGATGSQIDSDDEMNEVLESQLLVFGG